VKAIVIAETGGPEKLKYGVRPIPIRGENESLVDIHIVGVNFIDTYHRTGLYPRALPFMPGVLSRDIVHVCLQSWFTFPLLREGECVFWGW
jgi:NADPH:quinone reductase-like Zn-dependent oxidoreductase